MLSFLHNSTIALLAVAFMFVIAAFGVTHRIFIFNIKKAWTISAPWAFLLSLILEIVDSSEFSLLFLTVNFFISWFISYLYAFIVVKKDTLYKPTHDECVERIYQDLCNVLSSYIWSYDYNEPRKLEQIRESLRPVNKDLIADLMQEKLLFEPFYSVYLYITIYEATYNSLYYHTYRQSEEEILCYVHDKVYKDLMDSLQKSSSDSLTGIFFEKNYTYKKASEILKEKAD